MFSRSIPVRKYGEHTPIAPRAPACRLRRCRFNLIVSFPYQIGVGTVACREIFRQKLRSVQLSIPRKRGTQTLRQGANTPVDKREVHIGEAGYAARKPFGKIGRDPLRI